ncbi:ABC transporter substrate-binding protein [Methylobacterium phyllosphaerae]|uniref:ABC transporter substrate-binding protein n=1 Tax=Methylobacterium phyllosphaerae TaxID=418223 RepID=A0AAE8HV96_9HYPH|nr:ABC transporter substrate-binding protein [Methylobacterium phyllosphaerae]SFH35698.1 hypothetical protein SAMN05192567_12175 [Methylobacterium phyllosphaerae]
MPSRLVITFAAMMSAVPIGAAAAPVRVVSMNLCADELVLRLADRDQVLAVTYLARDSRGSTVATEAVGLPVTRGLTEEVVALKPDLVIAGAFTTRTTVGMLKRVGAPVLELGVPAEGRGDLLRAGGNGDEQRGCGAGQRQRAPERGGNGTGHGTASGDGCGTSPRTRPRRSRPPRNHDAATPPRTPRPASSACDHG